MRLAGLNHGRVDAYLAHLGSPEVRHDAAGLARLQQAHLMSVPFHNLLLLANDGRPWGLPSLQEVVDDAIAGVGGNCDRTTPPFTALLQSLGFDASLAAATVREPGDHFVCTVHVDGARFLCDVGNGHPYLRPWDLDGPVQEQTFQGWRFRFDPHARGGPILQRALSGGGFKTVYVVDPVRRRYEDFAPMVMAHYTQAGFGPFLAGLRAVCVQPDAVLTLRDRVYARDTRFGRSVRRVSGRDAFRSLLVTRFGLRLELVEEALETVARRRPDLVAEPKWFALGRGLAEDSADVRPPPRDEVPDVLVSLASVGRPGAVPRLLQTLREEVRASGYPGRVGVLVVENHPPGAGESDLDPEDLVVHRVPIGDFRPALEHATRAGTLPPVDDALPLPIGAAREALAAALRDHLEAPVAGLPHPADHPTMVWMVDDDIAFQQVMADRSLGRHTHLLFRAARFWSSLPQHQVVLGTFTGDPPIPGLDSLEGQLQDLSASIDRMLHLGPEGVWEPPEIPPETFDAYYDLSETGGSEGSRKWPYAPDLAGEPVRDVARSLLRDLHRLLDGQQITRPLVWDGRDAPPRPSLRRGGNTLFLDLDALFRWPTPVLASEDGVVTRRADTLWAALARADDPHAIVEATLPLLHGREGQARSPGHLSVDNAARHTASQVRGVVMARAVAEGRPVRPALAEREARVAEHRRRVVERLHGVMDQVRGLATWGDHGWRDGVEQGVDALAALARIVEASVPLPGDPEELEVFVDRLPDNVRAWRGER